MIRPIIGAVCAGLIASLTAVHALASDPRAPSAVPSKASAPAEPNPDQAFLAARRAYLKRDARALEAAAGATRGHLLADYVEYWQMSLKLKAPGANAQLERDVERMIERLGTGVPGDLLRRQWLGLLALRADWRRFETHYAALAQPPDAGLRCQRAQATFAQQGTFAADLVESLLMVPRELPDGCQRLLDQLLQSAKLGPKEAERRLMRAIESGSRNAIRPAALAAGVAQAELDRALGAGDSGAADHPELARLPAVIALSMLARNDPGLASGALERTRSPLRPADREFVWSQIAMAGMKRMAAESLVWTRKGLRADISDETLGWLARAALRDRDWLLVGQIIDRMSPTMRDDPAWAYWAARSLAERGRKDESQRVLARVAQGFDFYGLLANEDLGRPIRIPASTDRPPSAAEVEAAGQKKGLMRALKLYSLGLRPDGNREWGHALRGLSDRQLLAVATWACQRGVHDRCVNTAEMTRQEHDFALRFITPFRDDIKRASAERGLDPAWVFGLIRQESRFITDIGSSAGAQGLMQIMPATGRWIADKLEQRNFRIEHLHEARTNIRFGTFYLRNVLDDLDGSPVLASAGYNAGPRRPQRWRETLSGPVEGEIFAEIIPFNETRDYVKKVLANATLYAALLSGEPQSLRARLGRVGP